MVSRSASAQLARSLQSRSQLNELMDEGAYSRDEFVECLRQLAWINRLTGGYRPTLKALAHFTRRQAAREIDGESRPLRVLDVGFGYGDTLREIAGWAKQKDIGVDLVGIDINPISEETARKATPPWMPICYLTGDVFEHQPETPYDVVINALLMHHMDDQQMLRLLRWMRDQGQLGFFINDLHRHPIAYHFIGTATRLLKMNRLIQHDAPLSVAKAFTLREWWSYAHRAELEPAHLHIEWQWAFRYGVLYDHS